MAETFELKDAVLDLEVSEMTADAGKIVSIPRMRVQELQDVYGDDKPEFPVLRVRVGKEPTKNGNLWPPSILGIVEEQINKQEFPGYLGHISPEREGYDFPATQTLWLGARVVDEGGEPTLYVKGYNIPGRTARSDVKAGVIKTASWRGKASGRVVNGVKMIENMVLKSIDWARPGTNGMDAKVVAIASEMEGSEEVAEVNIGKLTLDDVQRENPSLFTLMKQKVEDEHADDVQEMKEKADKADEAESLFTKLRKLLKIEETDDIYKAVSDAIEKVEKVGAGELRDQVLNVLKTKLKGNERAQSAVLRLFPVTEMAGKDEDEIKTEVEKFLSDDEDAKAIVTEMVQGPAPLTSRSRGLGTTDDKRGSSGMVKVGSKKL